LVILKKVVPCRTVLHTTSVQNLQAMKATDRYPHLNPYIYCAANPIRYTDPTGNYFVDETGAKITYDLQKRTWSKNATTDIKRYANYLKIISSVCAHEGKHSTDKSDYTVFSYTILLIKNHSILISYMTIIMLRLIPININYNSLVKLRMIIFIWFNGFSVVYCI